MCPFVDSADLEQFVTEIVGRRLREQLANNVLRTDVPPRSLPVSKLKPSGTADHVIVSDGETAAWAAVPATGGTPAASDITVTESGIIIPASTNVQQAMRAIEFQAEQLRQQLGSHHHGETYLHPVCRIIKSGTQVINNTTGVQVTGFTTDINAGADHDNTADAITIVRSGIYRVSAAAARSGTPGTMGVAIDLAGTPIGSSLSTVQTAPAYFGASEEPRASLLVNLYSGNQLKMYVATSTSMTVIAGRFTYLEAQHIRDI